MTDQRYLLLKGIAGLGDRLMTLGRAIQLARVTRRTLLIDWSQESWNHDDPPKGFWHYFSLDADIPVVRGDADTYAMIDTLSATGATAAPLPFQKRLRRLDWTLDRRVGRLFIDRVPAQLTDREILTTDAQVVVYLAYCSGKFEQILPHLQFLTPPVTDGPYNIGVHFRNTDKANSIDATIASVRRVWAPGRTIWLATDDVGALDAFRGAFGDAVHTSPPPPRPANGGGIHHASAAELGAVSTSKEELNHAMMHDLYRLRDAGVFVGCPNSLFTRIVEQLRLGRR